MKKSNRELYEEMVKPRPLDEVKSSLEAFGEELYELRKKHRIAEMLYVAVAIEDDGGKGRSVAAVCHIGDQTNAVPMAATALRHFRAQRDRDEAVLAGLAVDDAGDRGEVGGP